MEEGAQPKWEGKATAKLVGSTPEQVWPLLEDFCSLNKCFPTVETCYQVEGVYGQPGLIRYCSSGGNDEKTIKWCREKLLAMDPIKWCFTYEVLDNNIGFKSYVASIRVLPINGDDEPGCQIEWSFVSDPIKGFTLDGLLTYVDSSVHSMAETIGKTLQSTE